MSGSSVRAIFSAGRTSTEPPEKKRSGLQMRPLRSMYEFVEPTMNRRSPPGAAFGIAAGMGGDFASTAIGLIAFHRQSEKTPATTTTTAAQAIARQGIRRAGAGAGATATGASSNLKSAL